MRLLFVPLLLLVAAQAQAQDAKDPLTINGSIRLRYETIDGQPRVGANASDDLVNVRTTLGVTYKTQPVTLVAELWDSRVYGDRDGTPVSTGEVNTVELVQAYAAIDLGKIAGTKRSNLSLGRMTLNIASRRLIAADDYRNTTNGYTGARADLSLSDKTSATLLYVLPQQRRPDDLAALRRNAFAFDREGFDLVLWGGTAVRRATLGPSAAEVTFYHLGERDRAARPTRDRSLNTVGGRLFRDPAPAIVDWEFEGYYQSGRIAESTAPGARRIPVAAWFSHADMGYTFRGRWQPRLSLEFDYASGDRAGGSFGRFDTLFGMRRADFAPAGLYNALARTNLMTPGIRLETDQAKPFDLLVTYHALWAAEATDAFSGTGVRDTSGRSGRFAGHQIDARGRWWIVPKRLRFEADGVLLRKGNLLRNAPNAPSGAVARYLSLNLIANF